MRRVSSRIKTSRNKGETIVEVMVAFMVLMIVLLLFGNSILAAGEAQKYAIDIRKEADNGMIELQKIKYVSTDAPEKGTKDITVSGLTGEPIRAVKYETSNQLTYWVFE